jgi:hypothetical protein
LLAGRFLPAVLKIAVLTTVAILGAGARQFLWAYLRTPKIVAKFERSTVLPLDPAQFSKVRRE